MPASDSQLKPEIRRDLAVRLKRIEGQAHGVQRMLEESRGCNEIMHQLASIRAAARSASLVLVKEYARDRLMSPSSEGSARDLESAVDDILSVLVCAPE